MTQPISVRRSLRRLLLLLIALQLATPACSSNTAALREVQGPRMPIRDVRFEGMTKFSKDELFEYLHIGETSWLPFTRDYYFDEALIAVDARRIEELYRARGYYQARVLSVEPAIDSDAEKVDLVVRVDEGKPTIVTSLAFHWPASTMVGPAERGLVERQASLKQGAPFDTGLLNASIGDLRIFLLQRGFPLAAVQATADVHEGARTAEVDFSVTPGPRAVISSIRVEGLSQVPLYMVEREYEFALGKQYSPGLTNQIEQALKAMRVFRWVAVTPPTEVHDGKVDLVVRTSEADPQSFSIGPDVAFEAVRWQELLTTRYTHTNLFGNLTRLDLTVVGGYAEIPNPWSADRHGPVTSIEPAFTKKGILENFLIWTLAPSFTTNVQEGYQYWTVGDRFGVARWFGGIFNASISHNLQRYDYFSTDPALDRGGTELGRDFRDPYLLIFGELKGTTYLTDSISKPTNGAIFEAIYDLAGGPFFGDYDFHKLVLSTRGYYRPWKRLQLVGRIQGGAITPYGPQAGAPFSAKFYLGGANTVRGFGSRRLSPYLDDCTPDGDCTHIPIGGYSMVEGNLELRYHLGGRFGVVGFTDMGDVRAAEWSFGASTWNFTAGPGLRIDTPLGLVRGDLGFRLNRIDAYPRESRFGIYVGLGEAF